METGPFDALAKRAAAGWTRRTTLAMLAALGLGVAEHDMAFGKSGKCKPKCTACRRCRKGRCRTTKNGRRKCKKGKCRPDKDGTVCGDDCADLLTDARHCGTCGNACPAEQRCLHGTCTCDPFNNTCPQDQDGGGRCACSAAVMNGEFVAACADRTSACDLDKPCQSNDDCPPRSVCLLGCSGTGNPNRCSTPCN